MNFSRANPQLTFPGYRAPWQKPGRAPLYRKTLIFSLLIHAVFLSLLARQHFTVEPQVIEVELTTLPELPKQRKEPPQQIVSPPDKQEQSEAPDKPAYRSETDSQTAVEQLKRGDSPEAGIPAPRSDSNAQQPHPDQQQQPEAAAEKPVAKQPRQEPPAKAERAPKAAEKIAGETIKESHLSHPLKQLALDNSTLLEKFSKPAQQPSENKLSATKMLDPSRYQAFSRPPGSGARFIGQQGSSDYLPNLPDGDISLLNTKADQFAVFVRRVATQVFGEIRNTGWEVLSSGDVNSVSQYSTFRAVLSLQGKLLRVEALTRSGSTRFDGVIESAVKRGARDSNPPAAAVAPDGNIHFIFQAKSWSQGAVNQRNGAPFERRWLLLATGLE